MKRHQAFRKIRAICTRIDDICHSGMLPSGEHLTFYPTELYLFGSTLTDKANPNNVDLLLVHDMGDMEWQEYWEYEIAFMAADRLSPVTKLVRSMLGQMRSVSLGAVPSSLLAWDQLLLFPNGRGINQIWNSDWEWNWETAVETIERNPLPWPGPRPPDAGERSWEAWTALSAGERSAHLLRAYAATQCQSQTDWHQLSEQGRENAIHMRIQDLLNRQEQFITSHLTWNSAMETEMEVELQEEEAL